jgi:imidazolonepropionase-like amidohydrolase
MLLLADHVILGDGRTCLQKAGVLTDKAGNLAAVDTAENLRRQYPGEQAEDFGDATILPGLFDMHVHLGYYYSQPDCASYNDFRIALYAAKQAQLALTLGITTVRDLSSPHGLCRALREASEESFVPAPRILHADAGICMSGGHGWTDGIEQADGPWAIRAAIRRQVRDGADWVKLLTSNRADIPEFTQEELDAAVDECHRRRIKTAVHAGLPPAIQMCIDAGFDTIEHGTFLTVPQARQMAENGQAWTPTITAYTYLYEYCCRLEREGGGADSNSVARRAIRDKAFFGPAAAAYRDHFKELYDTGVTVLAGSDMVLLGAPPLPIHQELGYMVQYGITPLQAIQTATGNPARVLGLENVTGTLRPGLAADLLVVRGDASRNIEALDRVEQVMMQGKIVSKGENKNE